VTRTDRGTGGTAPGPVELARGFAPAGDGTPVRFALHGPPGDPAAPVVVLSHGAGGNGAVWFQQVAALGGRWRMLTWDSRGFGRTPLGPAPLSAGLAASDLAAVLDHLGIDEPVHLVGQSMGGWFTTAFALAAPGRVRSIVWCDTIGGMWTAELRTAFAALAEASQPLGRPPEADRHPALWDGTGRRDPALALLYRELGAVSDPPLDQVMRMLAELDVPHHRMRALGRPMAMVAGEHDGLFPAGALAASAQLLGARFVSIPGAGHSPYFEQPGAFNQALVELLG
jgi:pimeloyl-ACP methyl ester carboxylesterase